MRQISHIPVNWLEVSKRRCPKHSYQIYIYLLFCNQTFCSSSKNATFATARTLNSLVCSFQWFASDNDYTNCVEITRVSLLSCNVIGQKKTKASCVLEIVLHSSSTLLFGGQKRSPEICLRSQAQKVSIE